MAWTFILLFPKCAKQLTTAAGLPVVSRFEWAVRPIGPPMPLGIHPTRAGGCVHEVTNGRPDEVCGEVGLCLLPGAATLALASQEWLARETFLTPMVHSLRSALPSPFLDLQPGRQRSCVCLGQGFPNLGGQDSFLFQLSNPTSFGFMIF